MPEKGEVMFATTGQSAAVVASAAVGGAVGGLIAAGISAAATADERKEIHQRFAQNMVDPGLVVAKEWEKELQDRRFYPVVPGGGEAEFRIEVIRAGFIGNGRTLIPKYLGNAKLVRRDGKVLWEERVDGSEPDARLGMPGHTYAEYMSNPALFKDGFTTAARVFSRELLELFDEDYRAAVEEAEDKEWAKLPKAERVQRERLREQEEKRREQERKAQERASELQKKQARQPARAVQRR
jgi:hypothetical protein